MVDGQRARQVSLPLDGLMQKRTPGYHRRDRDSACFFPDNSRRTDVFASHKSINIAHIADLLGNYNTTFRTSTYTDTCTDDIEERAHVLLLLRIEQA